MEFIIFEFLKFYNYAQLIRAKRLRVFHFKLLSTFRVQEWAEANEGCPLLDTLYKALDEVSL